MRLTFEEFKQELLNNREAYLPDNLSAAEVSIEHVDKLNHSYDALMVRIPGSNYAASVELDGFYERRKNAPETNVFREFKAMLESMDLEQGKNLENAGNLLADYSRVKENLFIRCSSADKNTSFLNSSPHTTLGDLAFTVHVGLNWQEGTTPAYTAVVSEDMLNSWGISKDTLFRDAINNSARRLPVMCKPLSDVMMGFMGMEVVERDEPDNGLYVLSNEMGQYGASAIIYPGVLDEMHGRIGDFYMLPSSVHEFLLLPEGFDLPVEALESMVRDVNRTVLNEEDFLSDCVYHYDGEEKVMEPVRDYLERKEMSKNKGIHVEDTTPGLTPPRTKIQSNPSVGLTM